MKYCGNVGFAVTQEIEAGSGVWQEVVTPRKYFGDVFRVSRKLQAADKVNDDVDIANEISIVADAFATSNFHAIRYVEWMGSKWKVHNITVEPPRLTLSIGGLYNEQSS